MAAEKKKITALMPLDIVRDLKKFTGAKNITESLIQVTREWIATEKIKQLNKRVAKKPLEFIEGYGTEFIRQQRDLD